MASETTNYKLKKIELTDSPPDITVINPNWDTIDKELKANKDANTTHQADDVLHNISVKVLKLNKDNNGIFTKVEHRRKSDNTLARSSVLSGGTSPKYSTRTVTYFATDGVKIIKTDVFSLSYDEDDLLISEV